MEGAVTMDGVLYGLHLFNNLVYFVYIRMFLAPRNEETYQRASMSWIMSHHQGHCTKGCPGKVYLCQENRGDRRESRTSTAGVSMSMSE